MKELAATIFWIFVITLLMFGCSPNELGRNAGKMMNAYEQERAEK